MLEEITIYESLGPCGQIPVSLLLPPLACYPEAYPQLFPRNSESGCGISLSLVLAIMCLPLIEVHVYPDVDLSIHEEETEWNGIIDSLRRTFGITSFFINSCLKFHKPALRIMLDIPHTMTG